MNRKEMSLFENKVYRNVVKMLKEGLQPDQTPEEVSQQINNMRSNMFEMPNGDVMYVGYDPKTNELYAGGATNSGIIRDYVIEYDLSQSLDYNLEGLYDTMMESGDFYADDDDEMFENIIRKNVRKMIREKFERNRKG